MRAGRGCRSAPTPNLALGAVTHRRIHDSLIRDSASTNPFLSPGVFSDAGLRTASGLVARVSGKVDVPGRTEAAGGPHHRLLPGLLARPEPPAATGCPARA